MLRTSHLSVVLGLLVAALAAAGAASARPHPGAAGQVVYVQTNEPGGNHVVVFDRAGDGTLSRAGSYATGGEGAVAAGAAVDTLASQGSLAYAEASGLLFAVNAGSDTVSVFAASGDALTLVQTVPSGGAFPASVAVGGRLVYVLDAGGEGSVQGFRIAGGKLHAIQGSPRSLGLANGDPPDFLHSPGQVGFTPDGGRLLVTTKASTSAVDVFAVLPDGRLSETPAVTTSATPVPFAFAFAPGGRVVVAEAGASTVSTYALAADGTLGDPRSQPDGQAALCWIARAGGFYYVANAGSDTISGYRVGADGTPSLLGVVGHTETGAIDLAASADGAFLYAESGGAGTVDAFRVEADGTLTKLGAVGGLPTGIEGIVAR
jgi:6-phosphogluconolactonase (cycloisomerase 2 family)